MQCHYDQSQDLVFARVDSFATGLLCQHVNCFFPICSREVGSIEMPHKIIACHGVLPQDQLFMITHSIPPHQSTLHPPAPTLTPTQAEFSPPGVG